jgi:hypothetical protein
MTVHRVIADHEDKRTEGGCDQCNAYQTVEFAATGVWLLHVHHDDWCPWFQRQRRTTKPRP